MKDNFRNYKLISDSTGYLHDTPGEVYQDLKKWLEEDFPENYREFVDQIAKQFSNEYGRGFEGYELIGGTGGRTGNNFFVNDLAIVNLVLTPVLSEFGKTADGWKWVKENILDKRVSAEAPTFAKRAAISLLLERLSNEATAEEAEEYLSHLIDLRGGIPSSKEVIFDKLRAKVDEIPRNTLLRLVQRDLKLTDSGIPTNVFVVILLFELMKRGDIGAKETLLGFLGNNEYTEYDGRRYNTLDHFHIIAKRPDIQKEILDRLLKNKKWVSEVEKDAFTRGDAQQAFTSWATVEAKARMSEEGNLDFLEEFREKGLKSDFVVKALPEVAKEYPEEVLQLLRGGILTEDVQNEIPDPYVREQIVRVALVLAEKQNQLQESEREEAGKRLTEGALWILNHFMEDPDPKPFNGQPYKGDPEFDYDRNVRNGGDINIITSVRGNIPWVLQNLTSNKLVLPEVYEKTKALLDDENYYVVQQALIPLSIIAANRNLLSKEGKEDLHHLIFDLLEKHSGCLPLASYLLRVFDHYRELNEGDAKIVLEKLGDIDECAGLFIYFAVYCNRPDNKFDPTIFETLLEEKIKDGNEDLRRKIAWHFWFIANDDDSQIDNLERYITTLSKSHYERQVFGNLDRLAETVIKDERYSKLATTWFENSLNGRLDYTKKKVTEDKSFSDWMQYEEIFAGIAKHQPEKFITLLEKTIAIAETGQVSFYDVKKCFEVSTNNPKLQEDNTKRELNKFWERVKKVFQHADDSWA